MLYAKMAKGSIHAAIALDKEVIISWTSYHTHTKIRILDAGPAGIRILLVTNTCALLSCQSTLQITLGIPAWSSNRENRTPHQSICPLPTPSMTNKPRSIPPTIIRREIPGTLHPSAYPSRSPRSPFLQTQSATPARHRSAPQRH